MTTRRGFFGMLAGLATSPWLALPVKQGIINAWVDGTPPFFSATKVRGKSIPTQNMRIRPGKVFSCGTGELGTLWWSKENS